MTTISSARREWQDGHRRFLAESRDQARADALHRQFDAITEELRRRLGGTFTLAELTAEYDGAERWLLQVVEERAPSKGFVRTASLAGDAAFHAFSRGAQDHTP